MEREFRLCKLKINKVTHSSVLQWDHSEREDIKCLPEQSLPATRWWSSTTISKKRKEQHTALILLSKYLGTTQNFPPKKGHLQHNHTLYDFSG